MGTMLVVIPTYLRKRLGTNETIKKSCNFQLDKHRTNMSISLYDPIINQLIQHRKELKGMSFQKESLDLVFVLRGLVLMFWLPPDSSI